MAAFEWRQRTRVAPPLQEQDKAEPKTGSAALIPPQKTEGTSAPCQATIVRKSKIHRVGYYLLGCSACLFHEHATPHQVTMHARLSTLQFHFHREPVALSVYWFYSVLACRLQPPCQQ